MASIVLGARMVLAGVFAVAGVAKLLDQPGSRRSLVGFGVPNAAIPAFAVLLPLAELAAAIALIPVDTARWGALAAVLLLLSFVIAIGRAMRGGGRAPNCHCFGQLHSAPAGWPTLGRNGLLAALAATVAIDGPGPSLSSWVSDRTAAELVAVGTGTATIVLGLWVLRLLTDRRTLREDLADSEKRMAGLPRGLPVGVAAPEFALPDLDGEIHTLTSLCARGRPVLLLFVAQGCAPCDQMFPEIGRWQRSLADRLTLAVLTTGTVAENLPTARQHGITMLLQQGVEVMDAYKLSSTPCALIVSPQRTVASYVVGSRVAVEPLIRLAMRREPLVPAMSADAAVQPPAA